MSIRSARKQGAMPSQPGRHGLPRYRRRLSPPTRRTFALNRVVVNQKQKSAGRRRIENGFHIAFVGYGWSAFLAVLLVIVVCILTPGHRSLVRDWRTGLLGAGMSAALGYLFAVGAQRGSGLFRVGKLAFAACFVWATVATAAPPWAWFACAIVGGGFAAQETLTPFGGRRREMPS
jgi:hypothetical protein